MIKHKLKKFESIGFSIEKLDYLKQFDFDINFIVGGRSNYKTSTLQCDCIKQFKEKHTYSIRLLRFDVDTKTEYIENFFSDFAKKYALKNYGAEIEYKNKSYWLVYYDNETGEKLHSEMFMKVVALAKAQKFKSNGLEDYDIILFDEFAPEDNIYLAKEVDKLISFISTVNRNRQTGLKVYLIGNMITIDNMYFNYYNIDAIEIKANTIYDYSIDGYQRVGLFCVEPVNESFEYAPRILRSPKNNVQETSQSEYEIPKDILTTNFIFIDLLMNDIENFNKRFYIDTIINITEFKKHIGYLYLYKDVFDNKSCYVIGNKKISKNVFTIFDDDYNVKNTTHTVFNSSVNANVYYREEYIYYFGDVETRKIFNTYF